MCNFNPSCQVLDGNCKCYQSLAMINNVAYSSQGYFMQPLTMLHIINSVSNLNSLLEGTLAKIRELNQKLFSNQVEFPLVSKTPAAECPFSAASKDSLLYHLYGSVNTFSYTITLCDDIPKPAYKDRCFNIHARILDSRNNYASLPNSVIFKLKMYTQEDPPKLIETNMSGDLAIRGNIKVESASVILFKKVAVCEVSSHFRNGSVFFVILPEGNSSIKPYIIEDFVVRARKPDASQPEKKKKSAEDNE
ncbi:hypothetical protein SteCoe_5283 [Stentor coeruleus]|uniref:Uncharacterized protein n=1 Tax=Stentor coeruleus TaxID=5963 RepID=A0A1R2CST9_9CILI|nr:hypothetical protein SteCoe_5283 [Stentor coeruleus]